MHRYAVEFQFDHEKIKEKGWTIDKLNGDISSVLLTSFSLVSAPTIYYAAASMTSVDVCVAIVNLFEKRQYILGYIRHIDLLRIAEITDLSPLTKLAKFKTARNPLL